MTLPHGRWRHPGRQIARNLLDAETTSLTDVESVVVKCAGKSELDYERNKAARPERDADISLTDLEHAPALCRACPVELSLRRKRPPLLRTA